MMLCSPDEIDVAAPKLRSLSGAEAGTMVGYYKFSGSKINTPKVSLFYVGTIQ